MVKSCVNKNKDYGLEVVDERGFLDMDYMLHGKMCWWQVNLQDWVPM